MKCGNCGLELTSKVYLIHIQHCEERMKIRGESKVEPKKKEEINYQRDLMKAELDRKGIKYAPNAKNAYLYKLIQESKEAE